jgi:tight adherence protein C
MTLLAITFLVSFLAISGIGLLLYGRDAAAGRLSSTVGNRLAAPGVLRRLFSRPDTQSLEKFIKPFENVLPRSAAETSVIQKRLIRAGYRDRKAVNVFYAAKVLVPLGLLVGVFATGVYQLSPFFVLLLSAALGFLAPDFWLGSRISNRQTSIRCGLPEALDLMVICSEAGLGLDQTIHRVSSELKLSQPEIGDEFGLIILEQRAGLPREDALKHFADRTGLATARALANTLIQADTYGTNIAKTLRVYSETLRTQRRQMAEELAAKTTVKLVPPLVLFIFPSIFVVTVGPAAISIAENFKTLLK